MVLKPFMTQTAALPVVGYHTMFADVIAIEVKHSIYRDVVQADHGVHAALPSPWAHLAASGMSPGRPHWYDAQFEKL